LPSQLIEIPRHPITIDENPSR